MRLPAEWEEQEAVLLTWPHHDTDWQSLLSRVRPFYHQLIEALLPRVNVLLAVDPRAWESTRDSLASFSSKDFPHSLYSFKVPSNDTWARDHGPICVKQDSSWRIVDFQFNGWGNKFVHNLDNQITRHLFRELKADYRIIEKNYVLEGGAIESDGKGTILTTSNCLLNPNRNGVQSKQDVEQALSNFLGATRVHWLDSGFLEGDDTDSHIDTLARFAPNDTIVYVQCDDPTDPHYAALHAMEIELQALRTENDKPYRLIALPWPEAIYSEDGHRLPATYANFLICNGSILLPTYNDIHDDLAVNKIRDAFPEYEVITLDARVLIEQHGSLHCITMQIPKGAISLSAE